MRKTSGFSLIQLKKLGVGDLSSWPQICSVSSYNFCLENLLTEKKK